MAGEDTYSQMQFSQDNWLRIYRALIIEARLSSDVSEKLKLSTLADMVGGSMLQTTDNAIASLLKKNG